MFPLQGLVSQVLSLEEEVVQLRQELNREELRSERIQEGQDGACGEWA